MIVSQNVAHLKQSVIVVDRVGLLQLFPNITRQAQRRECLSGSSKKTHGGPNVQMNSGNDYLLRRARLEALANAFP